MANTLFQRTIKKETSYEGIGLFSGKQVRLLFQPSGVDTGVTFITGETKIPVSIKTAIPQYRRSAIGQNGLVIETIEHLMSALNGLGITNLNIEIKSPGSSNNTSFEIPHIDGSAKVFTDLILSAGIEDQPAPKKIFRIEKPISYSDGECSISALPCDKEGLTVEYTFSHEAEIIGKQILSINLSRENFITEIAPARTFCMADEIAHFQSQGLGKGATYQNLLVVDKDKIVQNTLRFKDEFVRHKILDLIGDLYLLNAFISGKIVADKSGHKQNLQFVRKLAELLK